MARSGASPRGVSGPFAGAYVNIPLLISPAGSKTVVTNLTETIRYKLPVGATIKVVSISQSATAKAGAPTITIGSTTAATSIVASVTCTSAVAGKVLTLKGTNADGMVELTSGNVVVAMTATGATTSLTGGMLDIMAYVSTHPTFSAAQDSINR